MALKDLFLEGTRKPAAVIDLRIKDSKLLVHAVAIEVMLSITTATIVAIKH